MKKTIYLLLLFCTLALSGWSQSATITGTVEVNIPNEPNVPVPGYGVIISDASTTINVITDAQGVYTSPVVLSNTYVVSSFDLCTGMQIIDTVTIDSSVVVVDFSFCDSINIPPHPDTCQAFLSADPIDPSGLVYQFSDNSFSSQPITSWSWDFGDGTTSTEASPTHTYTNYGLYDVTLTIASDSCTSTVTEAIIVDSLSSGCNCVAVYDPVCVLLDTLGIFGYIQFPNECEALCAGFASADIVTCPVDSNNCSGFLVLSPIGQSGSTYDFGVVITFGNGPFAYSWDFGDGTTSTEANPVHVYASPGVYQVLVTVTTADGCTLSLIEVVTVQGDPCNCTTIYDPVCVLDMGGFVLQFPNECEAICAGYDSTAFVNCPVDSIGCEAFILFNSVDSTNLTFNFAPFVINSTAPPYTYQWDFGDGNTSTEQSPVHTYSVEGDYSVTLTVTDASGCVAIATSVIEAGVVNCDCTNQPYDPICVSILGGAVVEFPNLCEALCAGIPVQDIVPCDSIQYGCFVDFFMTETANDLEVVFEAIPLSSSSILSYFWDFGDGNTSTEAMPTHTYATGGIYDVILTVTYADSCVATQTNHICLVGGGVINAPSCQALFSIEQDLNDYQSFNFFDQSIGANGADYLWNFGDGASSAAQNPSHTYTADGVYVVTLTISTDSCTSTFGTIVFVNDGIVYNDECQAMFLPLIDTDNLTIGLINLSSSDAITFEFDFGDGTIITNDPFPVHTYAAEGEYDISLTITTADGCTNTMTIRIVLDSDGLAGMTANPQFRTTITSTTELDPKDFSELKLYPNPVADQLNIELESPISGEAQLDIINVSGQLVKQEQIALSKGANQLNLNVNEISAGMYYLTIRTENGQISTRFVK